MRSYRHSIVTFTLSLRVSEILPLLSPSTPLFPTAPLVYPKFPHVPLESGIRHYVGVIWATMSERVGLIVSVINFHISNLCENHNSTLQTDRQTDGRTDNIYDGITALCIASRGN